MIGTHLVFVLLPLGTLLAYPMYKLVALECSVMRIYAILSIALVIPLTQQGVLLFLKSWLLGVIPVTAAVLRASTVIQYTVSYLSLPLITAVWTLPVSPEVAASNCLLRCFGILVVIPISCLLGCFGGKRVVLAHPSAVTIWALSAVCPTLHRCCPDMRAACWTVGT